MINYIKTVQLFSDIIDNIKDMTLIIMINIIHYVYWYSFFILNRNLLIYVK